jgi:hypothetical protein
VYRDSGRRLAILVKGIPTADLAAELHTEFAIGPRVSIGSTMGRPGETADDVIARAREAITDDATRSPEPPATGRDT